MEPSLLSGYSLSTQHRLISTFHPPACQPIVAVALGSLASWNKQEIHQPVHAVTRAEAVAARIWSCAPSRAWLPQISGTFYYRITSCRSAIESGGNVLFVGSDNKYINIHSLGIPQIATGCRGPAQVKMSYVQAVPTAGRVCPSYIASGSVVTVPNACRLNRFLEARSIMYVSLSMTFRTLPITIVHAGDPVHRGLLLLQHFCLSLNHTDRRDIVQHHPRFVRCICLRIMDTQERASTYACIECIATAYLSELSPVPDADPVWAETPVCTGSNGALGQASPSLNLTQAGGNSSTFVLWTISAYLSFANRHLCDALDVDDNTSQYLLRLSVIWTIFALPTGMLAFRDDKLDSRWLTYPADHRLSYIRENEMSARRSLSYSPSHVPFRSAFHLN
ncbi:hypothetical protein EW146_g9901 [Bondarzewia mesenterica]|uniref:Uncharacterized protein n=1 Tax=Bondarzewia mesenterica TaxID=1095465 RepID=A0A4S4L442_9AGAM|nr:hypothetical protein EW146_g9901 [Bondarzewia mesenterica]